MIAFVLTWVQRFKRTNRTGWDLKIKVEVSDAFCMLHWRFHVALLRNRCTNTTTPTGVFVYKLLFWLLLDQTRCWRAASGKSMILRSAIKMSHKNKLRRSTAIESESGRAWCSLHNSNDISMNKVLRHMAYIAAGGFRSHNLKYIG